MKRKSLLYLFLIIALIIACKTVPITGRKGIKMVSSTEVNALSYQQYSEVISSAKLSTNKDQVKMIKRVGTRIQKAVEDYMHKNGHGDLLKGYEWEFNLIESEDANAWCMPGGKVAFYTGILPICKDETGVAVVMGHEIAHAIAEHGNERMSQGIVQQFGNIAFEELMRDKPEETKMLAAAAFGLGSQYGILLPYSRLHESEADEMGLYFMAMAGYNPEEAAAFWTRMKSMSGGSVPEFMSTHPSHDTRIQQINEKLPKAKEYYKAATGK